MTVTTHVPEANASALTPFAAALAAVRVLEVSVQALGDVHNAADEAGMAADAAREVIAPPDALYIVQPELTLSCRGKSTTVESTRYAFRTEQAILDHFAGRPDEAAPFLAALPAFLAAQEAADERSGLKALRETAEAAEAAFLAEHGRLLSACEALLRIPTADPVEIAIKREIVGEWFECEEDLERALDALLDAAGALLPPPESGLGRVAWDQATAAMAEIEQAATALADETEAVYQAAIASVPEPPDCAWVYKNGERDHVFGPDELRKHEPVLARMPPETAKATREAVLGYWAARRARLEAHDLMVERLAILEAGEGEADGRWVETPAPDLHGVLAKYRRMVRSLKGRDLEYDDDVSNLLTGSWGERALVHVYRDLIRLTGEASTTLYVQAFDIEAWVANFESLPGHHLEPRGPVYLYPAATLGDAAITDEAFIVSDPEAIRAYRDRIAAKGEEYAAIIAENRAMRPGYDSAPLVLGSPDGIATFYADNPEERDRLLALWEQRREQEKAPPGGAHLWRELEYWQKEALRAFARDREIEAEPTVAMIGLEAVQKARHEAAKTTVAGWADEDALAAAPDFAEGPTGESPALEARAHELAYARRALTVAVRA